MPLVLKFFKISRDKHSPMHIFARLYETLSSSG